jgi:type II secretory pathway pseudopilin PulG
VKRFESTLSSGAYRRGGLTMIELLVAIGIMVVVGGLVLVTSRIISGSQARSSARQQIALIAAAIDGYAGFWPKWQVTDNAGQRLLIADRGWPDYVPGRLFAAPPFNVIPGFNTDVLFNVTDGIARSSIGEDRVRSGDVLAANASLVYSLTAAVGDGPFLKLDDDKALLRDVAQVDESIADPLLPAPIGRRAQILVDPWNTPYRYFWVYREPTAHKGYLPIPTADAFDVNFRRATGYVLESAGPDQRFGNVWQIGPTQQQINDADDNLTIMP